MNIARTSIRHPAIVWIALAALTAWGTFNYLTISRREDPEIKIAIALIITIWPGAGSEKVEKFITSKIEHKVEEIGAVSELVSVTRENLSIVQVKVGYDSDTDLAWQKLRNKVADVRPELPDGIIGPDIMDDFGDVTAMIWSVSSTVAPPAELKDVAERFKAELRRIPAVGKMSLLGVQEEAIYLEGPMNSFTTYAVSPLQVKKLLDYQNVNLMAGHVRTDQRNYRLDPSGSFSLVRQIEEAVIDVEEKSGNQLRVRDLFSVRRAYREPPLDTMFTNGQPSIGIDLRMRKGYNTVAMGREVKAVADQFRTTLPPGVSLDLVHDQPREVDTFIATFMRNLLEGLVIVTLVMFLSMGLRSAAIIALSLPLSILATFALMPAFRIELETVTIGSFIVALGMLVDNAIVVTDNIYLHLERGAERMRAAWEGAREVTVPILSGTLATVFAFMPLLLLQREVGAYTRSLPYVVSLSLLLSLLLAVTLTPILAGRYLKAAPRSKAAQRRADRLMDGYRRLLYAWMRHRRLVIGLSFAALAGAVALLPVVGLSYFPEADRDQFTIDVWLPEGSSIEATTAVVRQVEDLVRREPEVASLVSYVGKGGPRFFITIIPVFNTSNYAQLMVNTSNPKATRPVVDRLNAVFREGIAGARVKASNVLLGIPIEAPIALRVTGPDYGVMKELSLAIQTILKETPGTDMVRDDMGEDVASLKVEIDSDAALLSGITNTEVALALLTGYEGLPLTRMREGDREIPLYLRLEGGERDAVHGLHALAVSSTTTGQKVPLNAIATVSPQWSQGVIKRHDTRRSITVLADVRGRLAADVMREARPRIDALRLPPGYTLVSAGEERERTRDFKDLSVIFGVCVALILLMLVIQFNSVVTALIVLFSIPLAVIGAVLGLLVSGNSFGFMAFLGVISLAGIVIRDAVLRVEFVEIELAAGRGFAEALVEAGIRRFRPIMLTAGCTTGGLIPLALFGGVLWEGMAWAMIFGLLVATVLTMLVIPVIYYAVYRRRHEGTGTDPGSPAGVGPVAAALAAALLLNWPGSARAAHPVQEYIDGARRNADQVVSAGLEVEMAESQRRQAWLSFLPTGLAEVSATRLDGPVSLSIDTSSLGLPIALPPFTVVDQNVYRTAFRLTLPIYVGGLRTAMLAAAGHGLAARRQALSAVRAGVGFYTAAAYVLVLEAGRQVESLEAALHVDLILAHTAAQRERAGIATPFDRNYAETLAADAERRLLFARNDLDVKRRQLNHLAGLPLDQPVETAPLGYDPTFAPGLDELLEGMRDRPELKAFGEGVRAADEKVRAATGGLLPLIGLIGEAGYKEGDLGYVTGDTYWQVSVGLTWNLGLDASPWSIREQESIRGRQARRKAEDARREMELRLREAYDQFQNAAAVVGVAARGLSTAALGFENAFEAYTTGVVAINTVIDAGRAFEEARRNYLLAYHARLLAELQLKHASGRELLSEANLKSAGPFDGMDLPDVRKFDIPADPGAPKEVR